MTVPFGTVEFVPFDGALVDFLTNLFNGTLKLELYSKIFKPPITFVAYKT